jgi:hypothetical protein
MRKYSFGEFREFGKEDDGEYEYYAVEDVDKLIADHTENYTIEIEKLRVAKKEISDAYLRVRKLVGAWDTKEGGVDGYQVIQARYHDKKGGDMGDEMKFLNEVWVDDDGRWHREEVSEYDGCIGRYIHESRVPISCGGTMEENDSNALARAKVKCRACNGYGFTYAEKLEKHICDVCDGKGG